MLLKNKVQLITYPDSLGGDLKTLNEVLKKYFLEVFRGGVHILPPFPSSGDRGFAPLTYLEIDPEHGSWEDIKAIGQNFDVLLDLMVNHISQRSVYFKDFLKHGKQSKYADMFITIDKVWPEGKPPVEDIDKIYLRRPTPFSTFELKNTGEEVTVWTTFGREVPSEQIDIDINAEISKQVLEEFLKTFSENGVKLVRLDAVGYVNKIAGTSCFFIEPQIYEFIEWMRDVAQRFNIELLPEVHAPHKVNFKLSRHGCYAYDFSLPYLILNTLLNKTSHSLKNYLSIRPKGMITMLDCHDGIPVKPDLDGLYISEEAKKVVDHCLETRGGYSKVRAEDQKDRDGFDVHQITCTYYSALGCNDDAYITARALQFFAPGTPQVYYVGLLAGENDMEMLESTGEGRAINRHNYTVEEIDKALEKDVVKRLIELIRFRNEQGVFNGEFSVLASEDTIVSLCWQKDNSSCSLLVDLDTMCSTIEMIDKMGNKSEWKI